MQPIAPNLTPALPKDEVSALMSAEGSDCPFAYGSDGVGRSSAGSAPSSSNGTEILDKRLRAIWGASGVDAADRARSARGEPRPGRTWGSRWPR